MCSFPRASNLYQTSPSPVNAIRCVQVSLNPNSSWAASGWWKPVAAVVLADAAWMEYPSRKICSARETGTEFVPQAQAGGLAGILKPVFIDIRHSSAVVPKWAGADGSKGWWEAWEDGGSCWHLCVRTKLEGAAAEHLGLDSGEWKV